MAMADSCSSVRQSYKQPSKPPLQVMGFNLSPNKPQSSELLLHSFAEFRGTSTGLHASPKSATSPRSALPDLLVQLPPNQSQLATSSPLTNQKSTSNRSDLVLLSATPATNQKRPVHQPGQLHCDSTTAPPHDGTLPNLQWKSCISESDQALTTIISSISENDEALITISRDHNFRDDRLAGLKSLEHALNSSIFTIRSNIKGRSSSPEQKAMVPFHNYLDQKSRKVRCVQERIKKNSLFTFAAASSSPTSADYHSYQYPFDESTGAVINNNMDFLNSCHLCRRSLGQGQDIFMYSGDKAFCSMECRYQQIVIDERKERCPPAIIRSGPDHQSQDLNSKLTMAHQYNHPTTSHYPNTAAAA